MWCNPPFICRWLFLKLCTDWLKLSGGLPLTLHILKYRCHHVIPLSTSSINIQDIVPHCFVYLQCFFAVSVIPATQAISAKFISNDYYLHETDNVLPTFRISRLVLVHGSRLQKWLSKPTANTNVLEHGIINHQLHGNREFPYNAYMSG